MCVFSVMTANNTLGGVSGITDDERLLVSRAEELLSRSENSAAASYFMTPREQRIVFDALKREGSSDNLFFWGGYAGAERRAAVFLPSWLVCGEKAPDGVFSKAREEHFLYLLQMMGVWDITDEFFMPVKLASSGYVELSHRDWLGSLMALGLKRQMLGDIVPTDGGALLFARCECIEFIISELKRAGRDSVSAQRSDPRECITVQRRFENISTSVATPRLDGVVRSLCSLSREKAAEAVLSGNVEVNYFVEKRVDFHLSPGDILTVRGVGKFVIYRCDDVTRRGRIRLEAGKYI